MGVCSTTDIAGGEGRLATSGPDTGALTLKAFQMKSALLLAAVAVQACFFVIHADAAVVASLQAAPLQAGSASQQLDLYLQTDSGSAIADINGINIHAQIGDGTDTQAGVPNFDVVNGMDYAPVAAAFDAPLEIGGTEAANPFRYTGGILDLVSGGGTFTINTTPTLVGSFNVDTTGVGEGTFAFFIGDEGGGQSDVSSESRGTIDIQTFNGSFRVTSVPEPGSLVCLAGLFAAGGALRHRSKRRQAPATIAAA